MALTKVTGQGVGTVDEVLMTKSIKWSIQLTSGTVLTVEDDDNTALVS